MFAGVQVLAADEGAGGTLDPANPDELFGPPSPDADQVVEQVGCWLRGQNPGPIKITCSRGDYHIEPSAPVQSDGSFAIDFTKLYQGNAGYLIRISGHIDPDLKLF